MVPGVREEGKKWGSGSLGLKGSGFRLQGSGVFGASLLFCFFFWGPAP